MSKPAHPSLQGHRFDISAQLAGDKNKTIYVKRPSNTNMGRFFTDDIDELVRLGHGDKERLLKIKSEYVTKKLVTIEDRKYVEGLIVRYMRPAEKPQETPKKPERIVPPPPPKQEPKQEPSFEVKHRQINAEKSIPKIQQGKKQKMAIGIIAAVIALAVSVAVINYENFDIGITPTQKNLELDQNEYQRGDIISISGKTAISATTVDLAIFNPQNQHVWTETVRVRGVGEYSTLTIAGGTGWEQQGTYTVTATYGGMQDIATFTFNAEN
jgi:hypothetical protein